MLPVRFCPFCGARQGADAVDPTPKAATVDRPGPMPAARDVVANAEPAPPVEAGGRHRLPATPLPSPPPPPVVPIAPERPVRSDAPSPRGAATRRARRNPGRAGAIRKLLAAGFVLFCAAVLWRQLVAVPHGTLLVHLANPVDGRVLVDGVPSGAPDQAISVSPGRHRIGLEADGVETPQRFVSVRDDETARLTLFPSARTATLSLESTPSGASITLDGRPIGRTPLRRTVTPGRHRVVASLADRQPVSREIALSPGDATPLLLALQPPPERRIAIDAPPGRWSAPLQLGDGVRFTLLFTRAIRVRIAGRVLLLEPGAPVALGAADTSGIAVTAVGDEAVPVQLLIAPATSEGSP